MYGLKKISQFLLLGLLIFSVNQPLDNNFSLVQNINSNSPGSSTKPHAYDFKFETMSSASKTLSGKIDNVLYKKKDRLYNLAFMTSNFDEPQTKNIYFFLTKDNIEIEGNIVLPQNDNKEKVGSFIPYKKDYSHLQISYRMSDRQIRRISNSGNFKITNLKVNKNAASLIVPVSFKIEFDGEFTCPKNPFENEQLLGISGFIEINPMKEESLIAAIR